MLSIFQHRDIELIAININCVQVSNWFFQFVCTDFCGRNACSENMFCHTFHRSEPTKREIIRDNNSMLDVYHNTPSNWIHSNGELILAKNSDRFLTIIRSSKNIKQTLVLFSPTFSYQKPYQIPTSNTDEWWMHERDMNVRTVFSILRTTVAQMLNAQQQQ